MDNNTANETLHEILMVLLEDHDTVTIDGICSYVRKTLSLRLRKDNVKHSDRIKKLNLSLSHFNDVMKEACVDWEYFSGYSNYPIDHPKYSADEFIPSYGFDVTGQGEMYIGEYGRRRLELVQRMIEVLRERLLEVIRGKTL